MSNPAHSSFLGVMLPEGAEVLMPQLQEMLLQSLALTVIEALPEDKLAAFEAIMKRGDAEGVAAFLEANVPDAREVLAEEFDHMRDAVAVLAR